jgi:hypothetical protein
MEEGMEADPRNRVRPRMNVGSRRGWWGTDEEVLGAPPGNPGVGEWGKSDARGLWVGGGPPQVVTGAARTGRSRQKRFIRRQGVRCSATKASLACGEEEEGTARSHARSLARVLSLFSRSLLLLFTSLLIPNRHFFRALSSGEIFIVCGGRVSVYLFCFVSSCGGEVWPEWKSLV